MNYIRRKQIEEVVQKLSDLQGDIESICADEQEAFDNLPESFQYSERGETMQEAIDNLDYASSSIDEVIDYLTEAQG